MDLYQIIIAKAPHEPPTILSSIPERGCAPLSCGMVGYWKISSILANIGRKNSNFKSVPLLMKYVNMGIVLWVFVHTDFVILEIKVVIISYILSKSTTKAVENNGLFAADWLPAGSTLARVGYG